MPPTQIHKKLLNMDQSFTPIIESHPKRANWFYRRGLFSVKVIREKKVGVLRRVKSLQSFLQRRISFLQLVVEKEALLKNPQIQTLLHRELEKVNQVLEESAFSFFPEYSSCVHTLFLAVKFYSLHKLLMAWL